MITLLLSLTVMAINELVKLLIRFLGVTKEFAQAIVLTFGLLLSIGFTMLQNAGIFSADQFNHLVTIFLTSIGAYEILLNKLGIDSWLKDSLSIQRGK